MRVLVTRPIDDARRTAARLLELGHEPIIAPLLEIRLDNDADVNLVDIGAIVATSSNGIRALARLTERRDLPVFAVGEQTALTARELGFVHLRNSDGDAAALARAIPGWIAPRGGTLLHVCGKENAGTLAESLNALGYAVRSLELYHAAPVEKLPAPAVDALQARSLDRVLLYSPRTAEVLATLVDREGLADSCRTLIACCISKAAADRLRSLPLQGVRIASRPDQEHLLALLD